MLKQKNSANSKIMSFPVEQEFWRCFSGFIVDQTAAAIVAIDLHERITIFNIHAEHIYNKKAHEVIGQPINQVFPHLADHENYLLLAIRNGRELNEVETYYCPYTDKSGVFSHSVTLVKGRSGYTGGAIWLRKDLTSERRFQQEMSNAEVQAIVSQIAAGTAHEIRNPLTTARGYIQLAQQYTKDETSNYLTMALEEIDQINHIISELLSFYHPKAEGLQFVNINSIVQDLLNLLENSGTLINIEMHSALDKEVPLCLADAELLKHALLNVLRNAMEAMPEGGFLTVNTSYDSKSEEISIIVSDTGVGINQEKLVQVFQPFFTTKENGSGLGLTLTNRIIQHHNGYVDIESTVGRGTSIQIHIPLSNR